MSSEITQSGTAAGEPPIMATGESGLMTIAEEGAPVLQAETVPDTAPPSMFRPTMRDVDASASEVGTTVPPRPLMPETPLDGETAPCTGPDPAADQALILGPPDQAEIDGTTSPVAEAENGVPTVAPSEALADGTNLFGDRAAMWSGDPSEVGAGYGVDPSHDEICLCDEITLAEAEPV